MHYIHINIPLLHQYYSYMITNITCIFIIDNQYHKSLLTYFYPIYKDFILYFNYLKSQIVTQYL